jgi:hypothetical protein
MWHRLRPAPKKSRPTPVQLNTETLEDRAMPDATYYNLAAGNFSQDWSNTDAAITTNNWNNIPSIVGYLGDGITPTPTSTDPQVVTNDSTTISVIANSSSSSTTGGVHEIANDVVALQGSGTAVGPYLQFYMNATGRQNLNISYTLKELDNTTVDQKFALQYRIGNTGAWINLPDGAITGTFNVVGNQTTPVSVTLPSAVNNQAQLQIRIMTHDAPGSDAMVGIDDIVLTSDAIASQNPVVTTSSGATSYPVNATSVAVDPGITVTSGGTNLASATVQITGGYLSGEDTLAFANTSNITGSFDSTTGTLTLTGTDTVANYQAALRAVTYSNTSGNPNTSDRTITFIISDGSLASAPAMKTITIATNQPPVNSVPIAQTTNENTNLVFSTTNNNLISISDPDAGTSPVKVTLTATHGVLTLSGTNNLSFTTGDGTADATMTFTGTISNINTALAGLIFAPTANYNGPASVEILTDDQGNTGPGGAKTDDDTVNITVNVPVVVAPFTAGDLVIYRIGTGTGSLVGTGNAVFLDEYTPSGTLVQSVPLPTVTSGSNNPLIASGTATSEGLLTLSADGRYLLLTGYDTTLGGTASLAGTSVPRVIGRVDAQGNIDTSTALTDFSSGNNPRSVASSNGTDIWVGGGAGGVRYTTLGSTTSTQLSTTVTNIRSVEIFNGQLYVSDSSGTTVRLGTVGTGLPTTSGQVITNLPGLPTSTGSPYAFFFADLDPNTAGLDTLYVAEDTAGGGQIQK